MKNIMLAAMVMFATVAFGQTAHVQGSHLEHGQLWQWALSIAWSRRVSN
jgi:hypothetical protein